LLSTVSIRPESLTETEQLTCLRYGFNSFDDTNPDAEEGVYFDSILEMVRWLGFEPWKITYSSDNFQKLYDFAMELTKRGKAFVCHCDSEYRFGRANSFRLGMLNLLDVDASRGDHAGR
jgi:hypothetical protein